MDTPLSLALKLQKYEFSDWILANCRPDLSLEDAQGMLPVQLAIQRNSLSFALDVFQKMQIKRIASQRQATRMAPAQSDAAAKPKAVPGEISQEKIFAMFADCVKFENFEMFKWLKSYCLEEQPRWAD